MRRRYRDRSPFWDDRMFRRVCYFLLGLNIALTAMIVLYWLGYLD